jgi:hypothetical protein
MDVPVTPFLTRQQLAARWHMSVQTLVAWKAQEKGPVSLTIAGRILYRLDDVEEWENAQPVCRPGGQTP